MIIRFTIGLCSNRVQRKAWDLNPHDPLGIARFSKPARLTVSGYLPSSVDPPGIEPGSPACRAGVVPLDHEPIHFSGPDGNRTQRTDFAKVSRPQGTCQPICIVIAFVLRSVATGDRARLKVRPGIEPGL